MKKRKILFVITKATWGGAQRYVYDLATNLPHSDFEPIVAFGESGRLSQILNEKGVETHHIASLGRDVALISDISSFFQMLIYIRRLQPDVIHLNSSKAAALGALVARLSGVPHIIFTVHGWPFNEKRNSLARAIIYYISWFTSIMSHTVIVVSKSDEAQGKQMWKTGRKISYVPIGIEPPHFFSRSEATQFLGDIVLALKNNADVPKIFTIAELTPNKGIRYGIEAIASLKNRGVNALYIVIGDGEERAHLKSFARKCGVESRVFFTGFIRDAAQYLKASDVFLLPSIKEGMPYVLLEAAIAGLPIVTTTVVNPEITEAYQNIRAVPPANGEKIADALIDVMREKSEHELFPAHNQFLLSGMIQKTIELYLHKRTND